MGDQLCQNILVGTPCAVLVCIIVIAGLWASNLAYDRGIPHYISRKIGHFAGGLAFVTGVLLFSSAWWPIILSTLFSVLLVGARLKRPQTFRGVGGSGRIGTLSEVWFALVAVPVFVICWLWLQKPFVALACLLFMAWGDCITGIVRARVYNRPTKGLWGSLSMFLICIIIGWFLIEPFWIGVIGAVVATATEWFFGEHGLVTRADDNWAIPLASLSIILCIMWLSGNL